MFLVFRLCQGSIGSRLSFPFSLLLGSTSSHFSGFSLDVSSLQETFWAMTQPKWDSCTSQGFWSTPLAFRFPYCIVTTVYFSSLLNLTLPVGRDWTVHLAGSGTWRRALVRRGSVNIRWKNEWSRERMNRWMNESNCHCIQFPRSLHRLSVCPHSQPEQLHSWASQLQSQRLMSSEYWLQSQSQRKKR